MTKLVLTLCMIMSSTSVLAAGVRDRVQASTTKSKISSSTIKENLKGFSVVGYMSMADKLPLKATDETLTAKSEKAFGIGVEYKKSIQEQAKGTPLSVIGGLTYETPREIKAITRKGLQNPVNGSKPSFSLFTLYSNLSYAANKQVSFFGGLNFSVPSESNFDGVNLQSALGYQTGLSAKINKEFGADIVYRWVNLKANNGITNVDVNGLVLKGRYTF